MPKHKIKKGLSDEEMLKGYVETATYEDGMMKEEPAKGSSSSTKKPEPKKTSFFNEFITEEMEEKIGKALLEIKMEYFKDGDDFTVKVKRDGLNILLETAPKKRK